VFAGNRTFRTPRCKWQKGVKGDAVRLLRCCNCKLAAQNGIVWRKMKEKPRVNCGLQCSTGVGMTGFVV